MTSAPDFRPNWQLSSVFPGIESQHFRTAFAALEREVESFARFVERKCNTSNLRAPSCASVLRSGLKNLDSVISTSETIGSFIFGHTATDSTDEQARTWQSKLTRLMGGYAPAEAKFRRWLGRISRAELTRIFGKNVELRKYRFWIEEAQQRSAYLMRDSEESLAGALSTHGGIAWQNLSNRIASKLSTEIVVGGKKRVLALSALGSLARDPDEALRRLGYEAEDTMWTSRAEIFAACLNGIKGEDLALAKRRRNRSPLDSAIDHARIDRGMLDVLFGVVQQSLPIFRRYFRAKAKLLGKEKLAWWDLLAPVGRQYKRYTFKAARVLITKSFAEFAPELATFAGHCFDSGWIDAEPRPGKRGGAFCMALPSVQESRILMNFDGSLKQVCTLAHELGHAFHNQCQFSAGKTSLQSRTPMTLAETASVMCESMLLESVLDHDLEPGEELALLDTRLILESQLVVDIYSRFLFERALYDRRAEAELSVREICDLMVSAQHQAYGSGVESKYLQQWMWTLPHYFSPGDGFYNFPYTFGLLFAIGLAGGAHAGHDHEFFERYKLLLASTGDASVAVLAKRIGIDLGDETFWRGSLRRIESRVGRYVRLSRLMDHQ